MYDRSKTWLYAGKFAIYKRSAGKSFALKKLRIPQRLHAVLELKLRRGFISLKNVPCYARDLAGMQLREVLRSGLQKSLGQVKQSLPAGRPGGSRLDYQSWGASLLNTQLSARDEISRALFPTSIQEDIVLRIGNEKRNSLSGKYRNLPPNQAIDFEALAVSVKPKFNVNWIWQYRGNLALCEDAVETTRKPLSNIEGWRYSPCL